MAESDRARTPPRQSQAGNLPKSPMTPQQVRKMEEARLRAKALRNQQQAATTDSQPNRTPSGFIAGEKRPASAISTSSLPPTQRDARNTAASGQSNGGPQRDTGIQPAKKFQKFVEYDFSKMTDTKGGFLSAEDDPFNRALHTPNQEEKPANMTLKEWERAQLLKKLREQKAGPFEPGLSSLGSRMEQQKKCHDCGSLEIDWKWDECFGTQVCNACKEKLPEKYSLLTKTEAKEDYLLTDPELKDEQLLPHLEKPNPHKSTWNNMMLYLRYQIEEYAFSDKKWGSAEALDEEFAKRQADTKARKEKKFRTKLNDLKRRTRVDAYKRQKAGIEGGNFGDKLGGKHEHEWGRGVEDPNTGMTVKTCIECGMEVEELVF